MLLELLYFLLTMVLPAHSGPWPLIQFRNNFLQSVGLPGRAISPSQGRYLHAGQHKHRINAHTDIEALSGIRTQDSSVRASENSSCLSPRGYCDQRMYFIQKLNPNSPSQKQQNLETR
jgi:hypothetical protein